MSILTSGRTEPCKDNAGGISKIYLGAWQPYDNFVIVGYEDLNITDFPTTQMYEFQGYNKRATEKLVEETAYEQNITMDLHKQDFLSAAVLDDLANKKVRAVVIDRLGKIRVYGLHNGLDIDVEVESGGNRGDYQGYRLIMTGLEDYGAATLLNFPGSGFLTEGVTLDCLLCSSSQPASLIDRISSCNIVQGT